MRFAAIGRRHALNVELTEEHRHRHLDLKKREIATRTNARSTTERGMATRFAESRPCVSSSSQRFGSNPFASGKKRSSIVSCRNTNQMIVPAGTRTSPIVVSRNASLSIDGTTGFSRMASFAHDSR
jgi:hypothetical protein